LKEKRREEIDREAFKGRALKGKGSLRGRLMQRVERNSKRSE